MLGVKTAVMGCTQYMHIADHLSLQLFVKVLGAGHSFGAEQPDLQPHAT